VPDIHIKPDRVWLPRHPLVRRVGRLRHLAMVILLLALWAIVGGYVFFTNENRVRSMAAEYLGNLVGGQVEIGGANLSLFEGLRLWDVKVVVPDGNGPQSTLLEAGTVFIGCKARDLLAGHLTASQILVVEPHVHLAEEMPGGTWNYELLGQRQWPSGQSSGGVTTAPEVLLRDAQVDYLEVRDGRATQVGWMAVDGRFGPLGQTSSGSPKYEFSFQSRGRQGLGPAMTGTVDMSTRRVSAAMDKVVFGPGIQAMLPNPVSRWCRDHGLVGRTSLKMDYVAGGFRVKVDLDGVELSVSPSPPAPPLKFNDAHGVLVFTNEGIAAQGLTLSTENNNFSVEGLLGGYSPDASMDVTLRSIGDLNIARNVPSIQSLPDLARELYDHFHPWGRATAFIHLNRAVAAGTVHCQAQIDVLDGGFTFANIPYPVSHVTGQVTIGPDKDLGFDVVRLVNLNGSGPDGSANANAKLSVNGWIGPLDRPSGGEIDVQGSGIADEPALRAALPPAARRTLESLDPRHEGFGAAPRISFSSVAKRDWTALPTTNPTTTPIWTCDSDLKVADAAARYVGFPYRVEGISGTVQVRDGYVNLIGVQGTHGPATVLIGGRVDLNKDGTVAPDLRVAAEDVPIDKALLEALPGAARERLESLGVAGTVDALGVITSPLPGYDFVLTLHNGSVSPRGTAIVSGLSGDIHLTPGRLETDSLLASRGGAVISGRGWIDWSGAHPTASMAAHARNLVLDESVCDLLPARARDYWKQLQPVGTVDADLVYDSQNKDGPMQLQVRPVQLSVSPRLSPQAQPLKLENVTGWLNVVAGHLATWDITAAYARTGARPGHISMNGSWKLDDPTAAWDVKLTAADLAADAELLRSLPPGLAEVLESMQLSGGVGFEFTRLSYRASGADSSAKGGGGPDVDFDVDVHCDNGSMYVGVPMDAVHGSASLSGSVRNGTLRQLDGDLQADSLTIAGRLAGNLSAHISKPADEATIHVSGLRAVVAGGELAGNLAVGLSDDTSKRAADSTTPGVSRYALSLVLNDADVNQLAGGSQDLGVVPDAKLNGRIAASLQLSGSVSDPNARRGRGDVTVAGSRMYQLPLLLGLFQITNLTLPISSPFERASADYSVQGQRVTLEKIQISGQSMSMQGEGHLDFATKQVELIFTTDNPGWLNVPIVGSMWNKAQNELMRIHVKGSISSPKVSASSLDTFTTTVDQVFKGEPGK
jgi:hypothetical protein